MNRPPTRTNLTVSIILGAGLLLWLANKRFADVDLTPLKQYAMNCEPCSTAFELQKMQGVKTICYQPRKPSSEVIHVLNKAEVNDEYKKYVLLVFLKLYAHQIISYDQSFEVRESPFLIRRFNSESVFTRAFCEIVGKNYFERKLGPEFLPAYEALNYLDEYPHLKQDSSIKEELKTIDSLQTLR